MLLVVDLRLLAPVAYGTERVVVIEALLADPVALVLTPLLNLCLLTLFAIFRLDGCLLCGIDSHVLRLAFDIIGCLRLLASVTVLTALEVIVLAFCTLPAAFRERIIILFLPLRPRWLVFGLSLAVNGRLSDADLGKDWLGGGHPLAGRHEDLWDEFAADLILTNKIIRLRDGGAKVVRAANGIGSRFGQDQVGQILAENPLNLLFADL